MKKTNKLFTKIGTAIVGIAMAIGVGVAASSNSDVREARAGSHDVTKTMTSVVEEKGYTVSSGSTINDIVTSITLNESISMSITTSGNGNSGSFWGTSPNIDWRLYKAQSCKLTFTASGSAKITSITLTFGAKDGGIIAAEADAGGSSKTAVFTSGEAKTISPAASSLTYGIANSGTKTGNVQIKTVTVAYEDDQASAFTVTYDGNGATGGTVPVDSKTYTDDDKECTVLGNTGNLVRSELLEFGGWTDGTDDYQPGDTFEVSSNVTLKAIWNLVSAHAGTENDPYTVAEARAAIDSERNLADKYAKGIVSEIVTEYSEQFHNISYNISADGSKEGEQLQAYRGKKRVNGELQGFESADEIKVGDQVVVFGTLKKHYSTYEFDENNQLVSSFRPEIVSISIVGDMTNKVYLDGDDWDLTGLSVEATYNDDSVLDIGSLASLIANESLVATLSPEKPTVGGNSLTISNIVYDTDKNHDDVVISGISVSLAVRFNLAIDETATASEDEISWTSNFADVLVSKADSSTNANSYYPGTPEQSYTSTRFYTNSNLKITPSVGVKILYVLFEATTEGFASTFQGSTWTNATASVTAQTVKVTPTNGILEFSAVIGGKCGFTSITIAYTTCELSSVALTITDAQRTFTAGDKFDFKGTLTATYSDSSTAVVTPSSYHLGTANGDAITTDTTLTRTHNGKKVYVVYVEGNKTVSDSFDLIVNYKAVSGVTITKSEDTTRLTVNDKITLSATYEDEYAEPNQTINWTTSNAQVLSLSAATGARVEVTALAVSTDVVKITASVGGKSAEVSFAVNAQPVTLSSIAASTTKAEYEAGQDLDKATITVTATYSDGSTSEVTEYTLSGYNKDTIGQQTVTISYTEGGATKTTTLKITVTAIPDVYYSQIKVASDLKAGDKLLIGSNIENGKTVLANQTITSASTAKFLGGVEVAYGDSGIKQTNDIKAIEFTLGGQKDAWTLANSEGKLLGVSSVKKLEWVDESADKAHTWKIELKDGLFVLTPVGEGLGSLRYNVNIQNEVPNPRFTTYADSSTLPYVLLFKVGATEPTPSEKTLLGINVTANPTKTTYEIGETFNPAGLEVTAKYSDDSTEKVTNYTLSQPDMSTAGTKTVTVTYQGKTATFTITVNSGQPSEDVAGAKTAAIEELRQYMQALLDSGEYDTTGRQELGQEYDKGIVLINSATTIAEVNTALTNAKALLDAVGKQGTDKTLSGIAITTNPTKTTYNVGEQADYAGLVVTATYSDGSTEAIALANLTFTGFSSQEAGTVTITVTYQGKTATFTVTVVDAATDPLAEAKANAIAELEALVNGLNRADYSDEAWAQIQSALAEARTAINDATDAAALNTLVNNAKNVINAVKGNLELAKAAALEALEQYYNSFDKNNYDEAGVASLTRAYNDGKDAIEAATTTDAVAAALANAKAAMDAVQTKPTEQPRKRCGGDIAATSIILSAIALAGVGLLVFKKRKED